MDSAQLPSETTRSHKHLPDRIFPGCVP